VQSFAGDKQKDSGIAPLTNSGPPLKQSIDTTRNEIGHFIQSLSKTQRLGLRDLTAKLTKLDSALLQHSDWLNVKTASQPDTSQVAGYAKNLTQTLTAVHDEQLNLGYEMGIQDIGGGQAFSLDIPAVKSVVDVEKQPVAMTIDGSLSRLAGDAGNDIVRLQFVADVSDLQDNITTILRAKLDGGQRCGDRISVQWATIAAQEPAITLESHLHAERWTCFLSSNPGQPQELAEGDGTVQTRVTPAVQPENQLRLVAEINHVDSSGLVADLIHSGNFGAALRNAIVEALMPVVQADMDFKTLLPSVAENRVITSKVEFREAGGLHILVDSSVHVTDDQIQVLATQWKSHLSAQGAAGQ
jgi:hypothetical protein